MDDPAANWKMLGTLWIVYGILRLVVALLMVLYSGTATVMFGALLVRVPDTTMMMETFHLFYAIGVVLAILQGIFGLLAGIALLGGKAAARFLSLVAGFLSVCDIPLGTTLGVYTLIVFVPRAGVQSASLRRSDASASRVGDWQTSPHGMASR